MTFTSLRRLVSLAALLVPAWSLAAPVPEDPQPKLVTTINAEQGFNVFALAMSPDGKTLASGGFDGTVKLWDAQTGARLASIAAHSVEPAKQRFGRIYSLAFSPDGTMLASCGDDNDLKLWSIPAGRYLTTVPGIIVRHLTFSPDGGLVAYDSPRFSVYDLAERKVTRSFPDFKGVPVAVRYDDRGRLLFATVDSTRELGMLRLWDVATGKMTAEFEVPGGVIRAAAAADGRRLVTAGWDQAVRTWDLSSGKCLVTIPELTGKLGELAFSPDGKVLASAYKQDPLSNDDGSIRFFDAGSGKLLADLKGIHRAPLAAVVFSSDGALVATTGDRTIKIWKLPTVWRR